MPLTLRGSRQGRLSDTRMIEVTASGELLTSGRACQGFAPNAKA